MSINNSSNSCEANTCCRVVKSNYWLSRNWLDYEDFLIALIFILVIFFAKEFIKWPILDLKQNNLTWGIAIATGLAAGFSTCMALVGGLILGLSTSYVKGNPNLSKLNKFKPHFIFNLGRLIGFFIFGGCLGLAGSFFQLSNTVNGGLTLIVAMVMLILGLRLLDVFPRISAWSPTLPKILNIYILKFKTIGSFWLGVLTFFLPCGFTQAMQLAAINSGDFWSGAMIMSLFALGTTPGLLSLGGFIALINGRFLKIFFKFSGVVIIIFSVWNLSSGYKLLSMSFEWLPELQNSQIINGAAQTVAEVQIVNMEENNRGYLPNEIVIKKNIKVRWIINAKAPYSCASSLILPKLNLKTRLKAGENIIEFMPMESGELPFSCSMGMYTGKFIVNE